MTHTLAANPLAVPVPFAMEQDSALLRGHAKLTLAAVLSCWAGFALAAWWHASGNSAGFDRAGLLLWREGTALMPAGPAWLTSLMRGLTTMGGGTFRTVLGLVVLAALIARRHMRPGLALLAIMLPAAAINSGLKALFARPRPDLVPFFDHVGDLSFPSGHSFNGAATYLGLALILAHQMPRFSKALVAGALVLSLGIAFSRVWVGVHWPTDAIAGWLGGTGWALLVTMLLRKRPNAA